MTPEQITILLNALHDIRISMYFVITLLGAILGNAFAKR